ncbi:MAG TPA: glycosyltransferase [Chthonomonadales bacterium]|nr:glycosyltransferase [Chthonomonadales bacterium]
MSERGPRGHLLIVSHTEHYLRDGRPVGWGATVREIDHLASLFERVVHIATLHSGSAPASALPYRAPNVALAPIPPAGGDGLRAKAGVAAALPRFARVFLRELRRADVVHVRCPANISMAAAVLLAGSRQPRLRWIKYAGNWRPEGREAWSYTFQRWWLRHGWHRATVTVNGVWPGDPPHVRPFLNPCVTEDELAEGRRVAAGKSMTAPVRLLFVGRLDSAKGADRSLRIAALLRERGIDATIDLVGDSPVRLEMEQLARKAGLDGRAAFHGWLEREDLGRLYEGAHVVLLPSASEGWPKVLSEAMAYGAAPVCSDVSGIPQHLARFGCGHALPWNDVEGMADAIAGYARSPERWLEDSRRAVEAARLFSYGEYLRAVRRYVLQEDVETAW